jgi:hypothetical protein
MRPSGHTGLTRRLAAAVLAVLALASCGGDERRAPAAASDFHPAVEPTPPQRPTGRFLTARVERRTALRGRPGGRVLARLLRRTEFGSARVLGVLERRGDWIAVSAPQLPNGRAGWVAAEDVELGGTDVSVRVDRSARRLELREGRRVVLRMPVAVGRPGHPTPLGRFAVTDRLHTQRADSPYGCCAIALSGHQPNLPAGWPGGDRIAIHATPQAETIGQAASLGCLRAPTRGVRALMRRLPLGAPVMVRR